MENNANFFGTLIHCFSTVMIQFDCDSIEKTNVHFEILCTVKIMDFITLVKNFFVIHSDGGLSIFCLGFCAGQCPGRAEFICNSLTES